MSDCCNSCEPPKNSSKQILKKTNFSVAEEKSNSEQEPDSSNAKFKFGILGWYAIILLLQEVGVFFNLKLPSPISYIIPIIAIIVYGKTTFYKGMLALKNLDFIKIRLLMSIAVLGACVLGEFIEGAIVIVLFELAERLEDYGITSSKNALKSLLTSVSKTVKLKNNDVEIDVNLVKKGDLIEIKPGKTIPLDGIIRSGFSTVDESSVTGEPIAIDKDAGDSVYSGSINLNGFLEIEVTKDSTNSTIFQIAKVLEEGLKNRSHVEKFIEKFSKYYTPAVLMIAIGTFLIPVLFLQQDLSLWLREALSLLIIACPCALVISTPISIYSAIAAASRAGVIIKGGLALEKLGTIRVVAFDKTRTLTTGKPKVTDVMSFSSMSESELLGCISGLELKSEHPLAEGIIAEAKLQNAEPHNVDSFNNIPGGGLSARCLVCKNEERFVGKLAFIESRTKVTQEIKNWVHQTQLEGKTAVVIASGTQVFGALALQDTIRSESESVVSNLKELGVTTVMLTGDSESSAIYWGKKLNIDSSKGSLLPMDKLHEIERLKNETGPIAMVGDGINDSPALSKASIGIAMGTVGSDLAIDASEIILKRENLNLVPFLIVLGRRTLKTIKFNTSVAVFSKLVVLGLAIAGKASLLLAITADVGVTIFVVFVSLRLSKIKLNSA